AEKTEQRIRAQLLVGVHILIAQRQSVDALRQHLREWVGDQPRRTTIGKTVAQTPQQVDLAIDLSQQQCSAVARHSTSGEPGFHTARKMRCKGKRFLVTLCHYKV